MNVKCKVTISRNSSEAINIHVEDDTSRIRFLELTMTLSDFAMALTGHGYMPASGEVHGLENVGKRRESRAASVVYPGSYNATRSEMAEWLEENCQEDGWLLDAYLGSQGSVTYNKGVPTLHYRMIRYVDEGA